MPQRIAETFARCRAEKRAALIAYLMAGDPSPSESLEMMHAAIEGGADVLEVGIPYSDPLADGPAIQRAAARALNAGATFSGALEALRDLRRSHATAALIAFTYYNPVFVRGIDASAADLAAAGADGAVVPDLPLDEAQEACARFAAHGLALILLVAPTTPPERAARIAALSTAFVYVVSRMGVTGEGGLAFDDLKRRLAALRRVTDKPLAVGFGVSTAADVTLIGSVADGVIIGSALVEASTHGSGHLKQTVRSLRAAL